MTGAEAHLTFDPFSDVAHLVDYHFMVNALIAGTLTAVTAASAGLFVVLRRQAFVAHTLSTAAFPGAAGALLVGVGVIWGYLVFAIAAAIGIAAAGQARRGAGEQSATVGTIQALGLASGFALVSANHGVLTDLDGLMFGTFLGIGDDQVAVLAVVAAAAAAYALVAGRRLWFASVDPVGAEAAGVGVGALDVSFLVMLALAVAAVSRITGVLLVFTLLVIPAATAGLLSSSPARLWLLTLAIALGVTWVGLGISYYSTRPSGFYVTAVALVVYALAGVWTVSRDEDGRLWPRRPGRRRATPREDR